VAILLGALLGGLQGLFFHREQWLRGYGSWPRRLMRLGHIAFFGMALLNVAFALTAAALDIRTGLWLPSRLLLVGLAGMPLVCYLAALWKPFRHLFFVPVLGVVAGVVLFLREVLRA
jgi:hypothetical protein